LVRILNVRKLPTGPQVRSALFGPQITRCWSAGPHFTHSHPRRHTTNGRTKQDREK